MVESKHDGEKCGKCKYFGVCEKTKKTACYLFPPKVSLLRKKKADKGNPTIVTYRPAVNYDDKGCQGFHEVFDRPKITSKGNRDGLLGM